MAAKCFEALCRRPVGRLLQQYMRRERRMRMASCWFMAFPSLRTFCTAARLSSVVFDPNPAPPFVSVLTPHLHYFLMFIGNLDYFCEFMSESQKYFEGKKFFFFVDLLNMKKQSFMNLHFYTKTVKQSCSSWICWVFYILTFLVLHESFYIK